jgi:hypothetical protein
VSMNVLPIVTVGPTARTSVPRTPLTLQDPTLD